ncbi:hypothetical protein GGE48_005587 [Rhizobium leguminosarum]|nr:hypothetical protein [Rhizobium leguminosarum]
MTNPRAGIMSLTSQMLAAAMACPAGRPIAVAPAGD